MKQTKTLIMAVMVAAFLFSGVTVWSVISNSTDQQFAQVDCRAQGDIMPRQFDNSLPVVDNEESILIASSGDIPPISWEEWEKRKEESNK